MVTASRMLVNAAATRGPRGSICLGLWVGTAVSGVDIDGSWLVGVIGRCGDSTWWTSSSGCGSPLMRTRMFPWESSRKVVGALTILSLLARSGCCEMSNSMWRTPEFSAANAWIRRAVARQGAQDCIPNWTKVAVSPSSASAIGRPGSEPARLGRTTRPGPWCGRARRRAPGSGDQAGEYSEGCGD